MNYNDLCNEILDMDLAIRFAGVCDETGVIKYGREHQGIENVLSLEETKKSNLQEFSSDGICVIIWHQRRAKGNMQWQNMKK